MLRKQDLHVNIRRRTPPSIHRTSKPYSSTNSSTNSIGIFGGTFDPPHHGHVATAEKMRKLADLSDVIFVPNFEPNYKQPLASHKQRVAMTKLAVRDKIGLQVDETPYTFVCDEIEATRMQHPTIPLYFIVGMDTFSSFMQYPKYKHNAENYLKFANILVANRPGYTLPDTENIRKVLNRHFRYDIKQQNLAGDIFISSLINDLDYSSTVIRTKLSVDVGTSHANFEELDIEVQKYIRENDLYKKQLTDIPVVKKPSFATSKTNLFLMPQQASVKADSSMDRRRYIK